MGFFSSGVCRATGIRPSSERRVRQPVVCRQRYHTLQQRVVGDEPLISNMTPNVSFGAGFSGSPSVFTERQNVQQCITRTAVECLT